VTASEESAKAILLPVQKAPPRATRLRWFGEKPRIRHHSGKV